MNELLTRLRDTNDTEIYEKSIVAGVSCYDLTEQGVELARTAGLTVDVDAYGCAFVAELAG